MSCERLIRKYGVALTIQRTPTVTIYGNIKGASSNDIQSGYFAELIATVPTVLLADGEVIYDGSAYYLVVNVTKGTKNGVTQYLKSRLLLCNASVTIKKVATGAGSFSTVSSGVKCLITKGGGVLQDDEIAYRERMRGDQSINYVYMAASAGLLPAHYITDGSRTLKVLNDISPYMAGGIIEAQAIVEV
jgi:hypothetical protein